MRVASTNAAFTLIELILVMTILTIAVAVAAPNLASFFRGRTLDSEGRRLLALTRQGQSRAVSEGVPMELWLDAQSGSFGLEAEPSYEPADPRAVEFTMDSDLKLEVTELTSGSAARPSMVVPATGASTPRVLSNRPNLPKLRFLPDGSISQSSPPMVRLTGRDGGSLFLVLSTNRYEIRNRNN
jgi:prepilin-type N-terminal cleavage/methylation domain-containing protein